MTEIIFAGPEGRLEGRYHKSDNPEAPIAIVLHPEPREGGTMNNKVTYTLFQSFVDMGFTVLRFNFRGVGSSQGRHDEEGFGELADATAALDWLQMDNKDSKICWVAGYSFGAWIGMQLLMRRPEITGFVSLAIPTSEYDFCFLAPCPASGLIIHASQDERVPEETVDVLTEKLSHQRNISIDYRVFPDANHNFDNHLKGIYQAVQDHVKEALQKKTKKAKGKAASTSSSSS